MTRYRWKLLQQKLLTMRNMILNVEGFALSIKCYSSFGRAQKLHRLLQFESRGQLHRRTRLRVCAAEKHLSAAMPLSSNADLLLSLYLALDAETLEIQNWYGPTRSYFSQEVILAADPQM
jgi:hypothetical protein